MRQYTPPIYSQYLKELERNPIAHLDRVKLSIPKSKDVMMDEWWQTDQLIFDLRKRPGKTVWNHAKLPNILKGTRLNISGAYTQIELHNILNRFPNVPVLDLYRLPLDHLEKNEILRGVKQAFEFSTATDIEVRFDMIRDVDMFESLRPLALDQFPTTLYFTKQKARTGFKMYLKADHMRFEYVAHRRPLSKLAGTSKTIIEGLNLEACLKSRPTLYRMIRPRIRDCQFYEDLDMNTEAFFEMSQPRNQNHTPTV